MSNQKAEIKACVCHWLEELGDEAFGRNGFVRRKNSLKYTRKAEECLQSIDVNLEHHPADRPDSAAAVYPFFTVCIEDVNELVCEMVGGQSPLSGDSGVTLSGPVEWTAPKGIGARWYLFQPDSVPEVVRSMTQFLESWTFSYLDSHCTVASLADASTEGDNRVAKTQQEVLCVIAAKIICGRRDEARAVLEQWFGKPGPRKRYQSVFEYVDALAK
jgi:hypothetical protein